MSRDLIVLLRFLLFIGSIAFSIKGTVNDDMLFYVAPENSSEDLVLVLREFCF